MAEIVDVMSPSIVECMTFIVDTTGPDYVTSVSVGGSKLFGATTNEDKFHRGDNLILLSFGFVIPESFTLWKTGLDITPNPGLTLTPKGSVTGNYYTNPNFFGALNAPLENYEMSLQTFMECETSINMVDPTKNLLTEDYTLWTDWLLPPKISMKNVPVAYNGKTFYIIPFFKILHSLSLA